jgi:hypothetical protein
MANKKPKLEKTLTGQEFLRWYYLKKDLQAFAKELGIKRSGNKKDLTIRIANKLEGKEVESTKKINRLDRLPDKLTRKTVVYPNQKLTQQLREFMIKECGPGFRFNQHMRDFFFSDQKKTLGQAIDHYQTTKDIKNKKIASQFEYNRFVKKYHQENPISTHKEMIDAWNKKRQLPK